jgi:hypothetical protein
VVVSIDGIIDFSTKPLTIMVEYFVKIYLVLRINLYIVRESK